MIHNHGKPMTKVRNYQTVVSGPIAYRSYNIQTGQLVATGGPFVYHPVTVDEVITSTNRSSPKSSLANFCLHEKTTSLLHAGGTDSLFWYTAANPTVRQDYYAGGVDAEICLTQAKNAGLASLSGNNGKYYLLVNAIPLMTAHYDSLRPDLTELSVPNFLLDLENLSNLAKLWNKRKSLAANVAGLNLNYQYGWRPTAGDSAAALAAVTGFYDKLKAFRKRLGKLTSKSKTVDSGEESHTGTTTFNAYTIRWRATRKWDCKAYISYRPLPIKEMTAFEEILRGLLDSLGFEINLEIVWDAIPFSFIIDWFFDVGMLCRNFRLDTLELPFRLENSFLQYKETVVVDCAATYNENHPDVKPWRVPGASFERKTFHRFSAVPDYLDMRNWGWKFPSLNQALLGVSLGFSRSK
jgi:hypothetical protein